MRRHCLALFATLALAAVPALATSVTFGSRLIVIGDSVGKVFEVAGAPDRTVQLVNKFGAGTGERFEYYRNGKTISITVQGGRVIDVSEVN